MHVEKLLEPIALSQFKEQFLGKKPCVLLRKSNPFDELVTLEEVEARLNDSCATQTNLGVIDGSGKKLPRSELYAEASGQWVASSLRKRYVLKLLGEGRSIVLHNMSQINRSVAALCASIEQELDGFHADLHIYVSPRAKATSFDVHRDRPQHKLYLQLIGTSRWTLYAGQHQAMAMSPERAQRELTIVFQGLLTPGSVLYMPPDTFHHVDNPAGPRLSLSIPFHQDPRALAVDRTHIPLRDFFEDEPAESS